MVLTQIFFLLWVYHLPTYSLEQDAEPREAQKNTFGKA